MAAAVAVQAAMPDAVRNLPIVAIGWATVDEERARGELDGLLAADPAAPSLSPWIELPRDAELGARGWLRAAPAGSTVPGLVVLEPDTEGRLAASLVRFGEGIAVLYLGAGGLAGRRLVPGGAAWGPHAVVSVAGR